MNLHSNFLKMWDLEGFLKEGPALQSHSLTRMALISDGSITRILQATHLIPISVEIIKQSSILPDPETNRFLELEEGTRETIYRKVWLKIHDRKILYASTILVLQNPETRLSRLLAEEKPLGILIDELQMPSLKDKLVVGRLINPKISIGFGLPPDTELWARHYRMVIQDNGCASVLEIFSPSSLKASA